MMWRNVCRDVPCSLTNCDEVNYIHGTSTYQSVMLEGFVSHAMYVCRSSGDYKQWVSRTGMHSCDSLASIVLTVEVTAP